MCKYSLAPNDLKRPFIQSWAPNTMLVKGAPCVSLFVHILERQISQSWLSNTINTMLYHICHRPWDNLAIHYNEVIMIAMVSQITSRTAVYSIVYSDADQRKHQSSASLSFVLGIHRLQVNSSHKWPVTRKMFPFDDVIMTYSGNEATLDDIDAYITLLDF